MINPDPDTANCRNDKEVLNITIQFMNLKMKVESHQRYQNPIFNQKDKLISMFKDNRLSCSPLTSGAEIRQI